MPQGLRPSEPRRATAWRRRPGTARATNRLVARAPLPGSVRYLEIGEPGADQHLLVDAMPSGGLAAVAAQDRRRAAAVADGRLAAPQVAHVRCRNDVNCRIAAFRGCGPRAQAKCGCAKARCLGSVRAVAGEEASNLPEGLRDSCVSRRCSVVLSRASCNGRRAASY